MTEIFKTSKKSILQTSDYYTQFLTLSINQFVIIIPWSMFVLLKILRLTKLDKSLKSYKIFLKLTTIFFDYSFNKN